MEDFRSQPSGLMLPAVNTKQCKITDKSGDELTKIPKKDRYITTYQLLSDNETVETHLLGAKAGKICSNAYLENPRKICSKHWHCHITNSRTGRYCIIPKAPILPSRYRTRYRKNSSIKDAQLFNILPQSLQGLHGVDVGFLKTELDLLQSRVLDKPTSRQETQMRAAKSNFLIHHTSYIRGGFVKSYQNNSNPY